MLKESRSRRPTEQGFIPKLPSQEQYLKRMSYGRLTLSLLLFSLVIYSLIASNPWQLPIAAILQIGISIVLVNMLLSYAYRQHYSVDQVIRWGLVIDVMLLTELIYFTGGAANPITVLYFLPIINAALFCSPRFARLLTLSIVLCYLLLFFKYWPLPLFEHDMSSHSGHVAQSVQSTPELDTHASHEAHDPHAGHDMSAHDMHSEHPIEHSAEPHDMTLHTIDPHATHDMSGGDNSMMVHLIGMRITFSVSAYLAMRWISNLVQTVRLHESELQQTYQRQQENEYWLVMGMQTATLAHELSTPLNNLELIYEELHNRSDLPKEVQDDVALMARQLDQSKKSLMRLKQFTPPQEQAILLYQEFRERLQSWLNLRPDVECRWNRSPVDVIDYEVQLHEGFWYAFFNILNNAADTGEQSIELHTELQEDDEWLVTIYNREGHLSQQQLSEAGLNVIESDKPFGLGLGVRLAHAGLARLGGSLELSNHSEGGVMATIRLPLLVLDEIRE